MGFNRFCFIPSKMILAIYKIIKCIILLCRDLEAEENDENPLLVRLEEKDQRTQKKLNSWFNKVPVHIILVFIVIKK